MTHIENKHIFIALSTLMLQPATEVENSLLNPILVMTIYLRKGRTGKENLTQAS